MAKSKKKQISFSQYDLTKRATQNIRTSVRIPKAVKLELNKVIRKKNLIAKKKKTLPISMNAIIIHSVIKYINQNA